MWDLASGQQIGELPATGVRAVAATTVGGRPVAVISTQRTATVWDLTTYQQVGPAMRFTAEVTAVAASATGHVIVCFGYFGRADIAVLTGTSDQ